MLRVNKASRFDVAIEALRAVSAADPNGSGPTATYSHSLISTYQHELRQHEKYTVEHGEDPPELAQKPMFEG